MAVGHIVYFKFKDNITQEEITRHMEMFAALANQILGISAYTAGRTFEVSYEATGDFDVAHCLTCESREALEAYYHHEAHQAFINANKSLWQNVLVVNMDT
jgi:hypothetical protein